MTMTPERARELTRHTPGPWFVAGVRVKLDKQDTHAICHYDAKAKKDINIANTWYDPKTGDGHNDARLIAAAPELLTGYLALAEENERMRELLHLWDELIEHQYSGSQSAMSDMTYIAQATATALREPKP